MANFLDNIKRITGFEPEDDDFEYDIDLDEEFEEEEEDDYTPVRQQPAAPAAQPAGAACSGCGNPVPAGAKFCPNCGQPQTAPQARFCMGCGAKLEPGAKFCPECGQKQ